MGWVSHKREDHCICKRIYNEKPTKQGSKNIFIKILKDVGMTVPKRREQVPYICSKTGDEGNIYAAKQGMRACNNNNTSSSIIIPYISYYWVTHIIFACPHPTYILPSSPVLLNINCPHPLSCCIYTALVSLLFDTVIPMYILQHFN